MELEKSRNGCYTLTFKLVNDIEVGYLEKVFNTVGHVHKIVKSYSRVFIRYKEKEDAKRALEKFGKLYGLTMALNSNNAREVPNQSQNLSPNYSRNNSNPSQNHSPNYSRSNSNPSQKQSSNSTPPLSTSGSCSLSQSMEKLNSEVFHLILSNLPKNYTVDDINSLVEEANPVCINQLDETRVFHLKFCHIVLDSVESLNYLIDKLNGFVICGEKLIAVEARHLLEWKEKVL